MTLRVDPNGFFLYWTGPNMVRVGTGTTCSGLGPLAPTLESLLPTQEGGAQLLADLSHGSLDRKC